MKLISNSLKALLTASFLLFGMMLTAHANDNESLYNQGIEHYKRLDHVKAREAFQEVVDANPNHGGAYYHLGKIALYFEEYDKAIAAFTKTTEVGDDYFVEAEFELGELKTERKDYEAAVKHYDAILSKESGNGKAYRLRGLCKREIQNYEGALADLNKAIELEGENEATLYEKGVLEIEIKDFDAAIADLTKVIEGNEKNADAYFYRAFAHYQEAQDPNYKHHHAHLKQALADYDKTLKLDPDFDEAYFDRGEVKLKLNDYQGAIYDFKKAIAINPEDLDARYMKALCNYHYGYEQSAVKQVEKLLLIDSNYVNGHHFMAEYYEDLQEYDKALTSINKVIDLEGNEKQADAFLMRAYIKLDLNDTEGACQDFAEAENLGNKEAHYKRNRYCRKYK